MIIVENCDKKNYFISSAGVVFFLQAGKACEVKSGQITLTRAYSRFRVLSFLIRCLLFLLCVVFVFLDTDYENGELILVGVKYKGRSKKAGSMVKILNAPLMNIEKTGEIEGEFFIDKSLLIAHLISVFFYSLGICAMFLSLAIFNMKEQVMSAIFFALTGASLCVALYLIIQSIRRYNKTLKYLAEYYNYLS